MVRSEDCANRRDSHRDTAKTCTKNEVQRKNKKKTGQQNRSGSLGVKPDCNWAKEEVEESYISGRMNQSSSRGSSGEQMEDITPTSLRSI